MIMRKLDAGGLDLLTPPPHIHARQALLHPHSANLDNKSLPAVGEKYVGLPTSRTLQDFAELFNALTNIDESDLGGENEERTEEVEETLDKMV
ncbi:Cyclin-dependent kinase 1, partial [Taenia solium]